MRRAFAALALLASLPACRSTLYSATGDVMTGYVEDHLLPRVLAMDDADLACQTGQGLSGFALSFERVAKGTEKAALAVYATAALCAEAAAREAELRHLGALRAGQGGLAQDARTQEQRLRAVAAHRYHLAWSELVAVWGEPQGKCPSLGERSDATVYLLGLLSGAQAVLNDRQGGGAANVPLNLPRLAMRGAECLPDEAWWGLPLALRAAVWTSVPGSAPAGADAWAQLERAAQLGDRAGVRLARAVQLEALQAQGKDAEVARSLAAYARSLKATAPSRPFALLDANATAIAEHVSDRVWMNAKGFRTPAGALGTAPDAAPRTPSDDGLLDDLLPNGGTR